MCSENTYKVVCKNGHVCDLEVSELEEVLDWNACPKCCSRIESVNPDQLQIECVACTWEETNDWLSISGWLSQSCPTCSSPYLHIVGSFYHKVAQYDEYADVIESGEYTRPGRSDYSEVVIHFCEREELLSILLKNIIKANPTGFYHQTGMKAVCLSEVPLIYSCEIRKTHGDYGIAFRKSKVLEYGGQPAIYLTDVLIKAQESEHGFSDQLKPFINVIRIPSISPSYKASKRINFLHEREWRIPKDVNLQDLHPVGLILPKGDSTMKFSGTQWDKLLNHAFKYSELI